MEDDTERDEAEAEQEEEMEVGYKDDDAADAILRLLLQRPTPQASTRQARRNTPLVQLAGIINQRHKVHCSVQPGDFTLAHIFLCPHCSEFRSLHCLISSGLVFIKSSRLFLAFSLLFFLVHPPDVLTVLDSRSSFVGLFCLFFLFQEKKGKNGGDGRAHQDQGELPVWRRLCQCARVCQCVPVCLSVPV